MKQSWAGLLWIAFASLHCASARGALRGTHASAAAREARGAPVVSLDQTLAEVRSLDAAHEGRGAWTSAQCEALGARLEGHAAVEFGERSVRARFAAAMVFDRCAMREREQRALDAVLAAAPAHCEALVHRARLSSSSAQWMAWLDRAPASCVDAAVERARIQREAASRASGPERDALLVAAESAAVHALRYAPDHPAALHQRALIALQTRPADRESLRRALALVDRALQGAVSEPSAPFEREARAELWNTRGVIAWRLGDARGSIASFERAIDRCSSTYEPWINLANARACIGDFSGAIPAFVGAAARARTDDERYNVLLGEATARRAEQQWREADALLERALALPLPRPEAYFNRAMSAVVGERDDQLRSVSLVREFERRVAAGGRQGEFSRQLSMAAHWDQIWSLLRPLDMVRAMRMSNEDPQ